MANSKISALPAASTPLAGTELVPVVQGGITEQVSVANLTTGRNVSLAELTATATTQKLGAVTFADITVQIGPDTPVTTSSGRILFNTSSTQKNWFLTHNWNLAGAVALTQSTTAGGSTMSGTDSHQWLSNGDYKIVNGNLIIGTSGKGIDFSATPGTGTSELLADYEEGNWTPIDSSGAGLVLSVTSAIYTKIGRQVTCWANLAYPATASGASAVIGGLPFASNATFGGGAIQGVFAARTFIITSSGLYGGSSATTMNIDKNNGAAVATNLDLSASAMYFVVNYTV